MSKPGPGRCVHCGKHFDQRNWDHVFPKSWYPDNTPTDIAKWQIPTCFSCNREHGKVEQNLMVRMAMCIDPKTPGLSNVINKALRSMDPSAAKNQKDKKRRKALLEKIQKEVSRGDQVAGNSLYPGFHETKDLELSKQFAINISLSEIQMLGRKLVKGLFYVHDNIYIEDNFRIDVYAIDECNTLKIRDILSKYGKLYERGPGIVIERAVAEEDGISSIFRITIWTRWIIYASVVDSRHELKNTVVPSIKWIAPSFSQGSEGDLILAHREHDMAEEIAGSVDEVMSVN